MAKDRNRNGQRQKQKYPETKQKWSMTKTEMAKDKLETETDIAQQTIGGLAKKKGQTRAIYSRGVCLDAASGHVARSAPWKANIQCTEHML